MWFMRYYLLSPFSPPSIPSLSSLPLSLASHSSQGMSLNSRGGGYSNGTHSPPYQHGYDGNGGGGFEAGTSSGSSSGSGSYSPTHSGSPTEPTGVNGYSQVHLTTSGSRVENQWVWQRLRVFYACVWSPPLSKHLPTLLYLHTYT